MTTLKHFHRVGDVGVPPEKPVGLNWQPYERRCPGLGARLLDQRVGVWRFEAGWTLVLVDEPSNPAIFGRKQRVNLGGNDGELLCLDHLASVILKDREVSERLRIFEPEVFALQKDPVFIERGQ